MTVDMGLDIESIEALDFEYAPPCDWNEGDCGKTAEWKMVVSCCGHMFLFCEQHKVTQLMLVEQVLASGGQIDHTDAPHACGAMDIRIILVERL